MASEEYHGFNEYAFGGQLREELVELVGCSELLQDHASSSGSHRLSSGSAMQSDNNIPLYEGFSKAFI